MADCTCVYIESGGSPTGRRCLYRDPTCPVHYEPVPQYDQAGRLRPITERFPKEMKVG